MSFWDLFKSKRQEERPELRPYTLPDDHEQILEIDPELAAMSAEDRDWLAYYLLEADWIMVSSTNVEAIKYNFDDRTMDVEFQHGRYYTYYAVPPQFFVDLFRASSPGQFVWNEIRRPDRFDYTRYGFGGGSRPTGKRNIEGG